MDSCFAVIVVGFDPDAIVAAAALLYKGEVAVGPDVDSGARVTNAFPELIVPNCKVRFKI